MAQFARDPDAAPEIGTLVANLQHHGHAWRATEAIWSRVALTPDQRCHGLGVHYPSQFCAAYVSRETVWFQAGRRSWRAEDIHRITQKDEGLRTASYVLVMADGSCDTVKITIPLGAVAQRMIDPAYDEIDSSFDDIMKLFPFVAVDGRTAGDSDVAAWADRVLELWGSGFKYGP